jgi:hypothetical protein
LTSTDKTTLNKYTQSPTSRLATIIGSHGQKIDTIYLFFAWENQLIIGIFQQNPHDTETHPDIR